MSSIVDTRIVQMLFDNKQFESGAQESMNTLEKLKSASGLNGLASSIDTVTSRFSNMGMIAAGALQRIGAEAYDAGKRIVKSLVTDQITAGWNKYAEKTTAVQTIMAATADQFSDTGLQMDYVNKQLEKLNWFTDETSYNFTDMVGNIGKFTSNGIKLESAVTSMQGIANWAAISGQNAASASRAMYNLSQSLGMGAVKLQDWMSIENANMATKQFKEQVIEAALAVGTLRKDCNGTYRTIAKGTEVTTASFRSALAEGWFDTKTLETVLAKYGEVTNKLYDISDASGATATDILSLVEAEKKGKLSSGELMEALGAEATMSLEEFRDAIKDLASEENEFGINAFKAAQEAKTFQDAIDATKDAVSTGWMNTFETIFGDYEHARHLWTDFANNLWDVFASGGERRNATLADWASSGWDVVEKRVKAAGVSVSEFEETVTSMAKHHGIDIDGLIEEYGSLNDAIKSGAIGSKELSAVIKNSALAYLTNTDQIVLSTAVAEKRIKSYTDTIRKLWSDTNLSNEDRVQALKDEGFAYEGLEEIVAKVAAGVDLSLENLTESQREALGLYNEQRDILRDLIKDEELLANLEGFNGREMLAMTMNNAFEALGNTMEAVRNIWHRFFPELTGDKLKSFSEGIQNATEHLVTMSEDLLGAEDSTSLFGEVLYSAFGALRQVADLFKTVGAAIKEFFGMLSPVTTAIGHLAQSIFNLIGSIAGQTNSFLKTLDLTDSATTAIDALAAAIEWVSGKIDNFKKKIDTGGLGGAFEALKGIVDGVSSTITEFFGKLKNGTLGKTFVKEGGIIQTVMGKLQTTFGEFPKTLDGIKGAASKAFGFLKEKIANLSTKDILSLSASVGVLFAAFKKGQRDKAIGDFFVGLKEKISSFGEVFEGLTGIFGKASGGFKDICKGIMELAIAVGVLAVALLILASIPAVDMARALKSMGMVLVEVGAALIILSNAAKPAQLVASATALILTAGALVILGAALAAFALVSKIDTVGAGLKNMAMVLGEVSIALMLLSNACNPISIVASAAAVLIMSAALIVLAGALAAFTLVSRMDDIASGMKNLITTLAVATGALAILSALGPVVLAAAAAMLVLSVAVIALAAGLAILSAIDPIKLATAVKTLIVELAACVAGLAILSALGPSVIVGAGAMLVLAAALLVLNVALAAAGVALPLLSLGLSALSSGIIDLCGGIGTGIAEICAGILEGATSMGEAIKVAFEGVRDAVIALGEGIESLLASIGQGIGEGFEAIGTGIQNGIANIGTGIESFGQSLANTGTNLESFGKSVRTLEGISWFSTAAGIVELSGALKKLNKNKLDTSSVNGIESYASALQSISSIGSEIGTTLTNMTTQMNTAGQDMGANLATGITSQSGTVEAAAKQVATGASTSVSSVISQFSSIGLQLSSGLAQGIMAGSSSVINAAIQVANSAANAARSALGVHSPSKVFAEIGNYAGLGMAEGLDHSANKVVESAEDMANAAIASATEFANKISSIVQNDMNATPTVTPVVDLENVKESAKSISGMLEGSGTYSLGSTIQRNVSAIQNANAAPSIVSLDPNSVYALSSNGQGGSSTPTNVTVNFSGSLAQLASILQPEIIAETERRGPSFIKVGGRA